MKNLFSLFFLSLLLSFSSCSNDELLIPDSETSDSFCFEISLPSEMRTRTDGTRTYGDGSSVSNLKYYVYMQSDGANAEPFLSGDVVLSTVNGKRGGNLSVQLPDIGKYDFVFIASADNPENSAGKIYYNKSLRTLNVNYNKFSANDEAGDCFFATLKNVDKDQGFSYSISLKRPMAQLNVGTKDLSDYNALASSQLKSVSVAVNGVYSSMNVMDGKVSGSANKITFPASALPSGQTFPVADNSYLSMNYVLVNERKNVDVTVTASNATSSFTSEIKSVPLQRNHQTNIYGNLLTKVNDFKVEINPNFGGSESNEIETGPKEYDLILKLSDDCTPTMTSNYPVLRYYTEDGLLHNLDLKSYIDSDKYVKLRWNEAGITNVEKFEFAGVVGYGNLYCKIVSVEKFNINKFDITDFSDFFNNCKLLTDISGIRDWDTSKVTTMKNMFGGCGSLVDANLLDLSNFNTSNVTDMSLMFYNCNNLTSLDGLNFDTSKVTDMSTMFYNCSGLTSLDGFNFDTSNVTDMSFMFSRCTGLKSPDLSIDTSKVTTMKCMFSGCSGLTSLDITSFDTSNVIDMSNMFGACYNLASLNLSNINTSNVADMSSMFYGCYNLASLNLSNINTSNVTNMEHMFENCNSLPSLNLSSFDTSKVTDMSYMFKDCDNLTSLDLSNFNASNVTSMFHMFYGCYNLTSLDISNFNASKITTMVGMFGECNKLASLNLSSFDTSNVFDMSILFNDCYSLTSLDLSNFNTSNVTNMERMFSGCSGLTSLDITSFDTSKVTNMIGMFGACYNLASLNLSNFDTSKVTTMSGMFSFCTGLTSLNLSSFNTSNVTNMYSMFLECTSLTSLDLSGFDTSKVTTMANMFAGCTSLTSLDLSNFNTVNVTNSDAVLANCPAKEQWQYLFP